MGALNAENRFFAGAFGPAVSNVGMIAGVLLLARQVDPPILALAIGVLAGGVGQLFVQMPDLARAGLLRGPSWEPRHPALVRMARLLAPAVFGLAALQVMVFLNTLLASLLPAGSISFLYYADRVMEFPLGVFGIALASAALPAMSRQAAAGDTRALAGAPNLALALMRPLGHAGLAYASSIGAFVNLLTLLWVARRRFGRLGGRALLASSLRTATASAPLAACCWLALPILGVRRGLAVDATLLLTTIAVGALVFWLASAALGSSERRTLGRVLGTRRAA